MANKNNYICGHCGYKGPCYGNGYSGPWCYRCQMNDKLIPTKEEETKNATSK